MPVDDYPADEGDGAPRQSYNFAPGYHGVVYRADVSDRGAGPHQSRDKGKTTGDTSNAGAKAVHDQDTTVPTSSAADPVDAQDADTTESSTQHYKLQSMKWGLIPFWTKRNPDYATVLKTINCRDDSLANNGGMWQTMKARKRCIVIAEGFFEWLKTGKERIPYYIKRKDGQLLCLTGLWDCVRYEDDDEASKSYTYTIITTDSNKQLKFLHDRMPVIMEPGSEKLRTWLDPGRYEWSQELGDLLKPFEGELEIYAVSKDMNKVGNSSPNFIIPVASKQNKNNIANFFANAAKKKEEKDKEKLKAETKTKKEPSSSSQDEADTLMFDESILAPMDESLDEESPKTGVKREAEDSIGGPPVKKVKVESSPAKASSAKVAGRQKISATSNGTQPAETKSSGTQRITKFLR